MYQYQEQTIEEIEKAVTKVEQKTEEHYRLHIATIYDIDSLEPDNEYIYVEINGESRFTIQSDIDYNMSDGTYYRGCQPKNYNRVHFEKDIFLEINNLFDKVINDEKECKKFHERLNLELKALNKILEG